jgi:monoamine oxidase
MGGRTGGRNKLTDYDLVIVGAGASGLSAAKTARSAGLKVLILEAKSRIGGRAYTESTSLGVPFDHGAHFLHSASRNPFRHYADAHGLTYLNGGYDTRIHNGGRWYLPAEKSNFFERANALLDHISVAGDARDTLSTSDAIMKGNALATEETEFFHGYYEEFLGASARHVAAAEHTRYCDSFEDWPVQNGFGALLAHYGVEIPVSLNRPVNEIDYSGKNIVLKTPHGNISARSVIVTVSTGVLSSGAIKFTPQLPATKLSALEALPMGYAGKVAFRLTGHKMQDLTSQHALAMTRDGTFANLHVKPFGQSMISTIVGGAQWKLLEYEGAAALIETARSMITEIYGSDVRSQLLGRVLTTNWLSDPHVLGGHSYMRPGFGQARKSLAEPIAERLFFAGEATSFESWATMHGAYTEGIRAANEAVRHLRRS